MKTPPYEEIHYYHPLLYVGIGAIALALLVVGTLLVFWSGLNPWSIIFVLGALLFGVLGLAKGRLVISVCQEALTLSYGWLGTKNHIIPLKSIRHVRVCMVKPSRSHNGLGARGISTHVLRVGRGLEVATGNTVLRIRSCNPSQLKQELLPQIAQTIADAEVESPAKLTIPKSARPRHASWGLLKPEDVLQGQNA